MAGNECKICGKLMYRKFPNHLMSIHGLDRQEYYDKYVKTDPNDGNCLYCNKPTQFKGIAKGLSYNEFCSASCKITYMHISIQSDPVRAKKWNDRISQTMKEQWEDPETCERWCRRISEEQKSHGGVNAKVEARRAVDPEYDLYIAKIKADNSTRTKRTHYKEYYLRSSWELEFASFLDENNIIYDYESLLIKYGTSKYVTDFYIKKLNLVVEIHPIKLTNEVMILKMKATKKKGYNFYFMNENNWDKLKTRILTLYNL